MLKKPLLFFKETDPKPANIRLHCIGPSTARRAWKQITIVSICALGASLLAAGYRHLIAQSLGQGFVLQELRPVMDAAIAAGEKLQLWDSLFLLIVLSGIFLFLLIPFLYSLLRGGTAGISRGLFLICAVLLLVTLAIRANNLLVSLVGIAGIIASGRFMQKRPGETDSAGQIKKTELLLLGGIMLLALLVRLYQLDIFPARYTTDEQLLAGSALELGENPARFFSQPHYMKPHLVKIIEIRSAFSLLGVGLFQQRTASAVAGTLCVFFVYLLTRRLWGNAAGLFAAFLVAFDPWHIGYSKSGVHEIEGPLVLAMMLLVLIRIIETGGIRNFMLLGLLAGLSLYLYLANMILAPFAFAAALLISVFVRKEPKGKMAAEFLAMTGVFIVVLLPHLTFGRANVKEMLAIYSGSSNFLAAAKYYHVSPLLMLPANLAKAMQAFLQWGPSSHPAGEFRPNPITSGLALFGLGMLIARFRNPKSLLVLLWIPVAFMPAALGFGFEDRRLFSTLLPIPMMLAGLALAREWPNSPSDHSRAGAAASKVFVLLILITIALGNLYITFADTDSSFGRPAQPKKAAEFVSSLPPEYFVIITNRIKEYPFLLYVLNYEKLHRHGAAPRYGFIEFAEIQPRAQELASKPDIVLLLDPGPKEEQFLEQIHKLNPNAAVIKKRDYWACLMKPDLSAETPQ